MSFLLWVRVLHYYPKQSIIEWVIHWREKFDILEKFSFIIWSIWKERNRTFFTKERLFHIRAFYRACFTWYEWRLKNPLEDVFLNNNDTNNIQQASRTSPPNLVSWQPPHISFFWIEFWRVGKEKFSISTIHP